MITLRNVTKSFGALKAVHELSLEVGDGEIVGLLGPNGAGKTTTIRMTTGLLAPTDGEILIDGVSISTQPETAKARLAYIPDEPYVYEKLTGYEFLQFVGDLYGMSKKEQTARIQELGSLFVLDDILDRRAEEYSRGNRQRLSIVAALLHKPRALLIDEPVVGLDPFTIRLVKDLLKRLVREQNISILLSTHTLNVAEEICDRIGILHRGQLIALGTFAELLARFHREQDTLEDLFLRLTSTPTA